MDKHSKCVRIFDEGYRLAVVKRGRKNAHFVPLRIPLVRRKVSVRQLESMIAATHLSEGTINGMDYPMDRMRKRLKRLMDEHQRFYGSVPRTVQLLLEDVSYLNTDS